MATLYLIFEVRILQLLSTWPKETQPQNLLRITFGLASLLILGLSYWVLDLKGQHKTNISDNQPTPSTFPWKYHDKISLELDSYHDVLTKHGKQFFRITLKDVSRKKMPPPYESDHMPEEIMTDVATVGFSHGFMLTHGARIKKVETSPLFDEYCYDMSKIENDEEDRYSVFFFKTEHVDDGEFFFRCYVDHINPTKKEAELNIYFIWTNNSNKSKDNSLVLPATSKKLPKPVDLDETQINILKYLAACGSTYIPLYTIMSDCGLSEQIVLYHLQELVDRRMIECSKVNYQTMWSIDHAGRAYLVKHKLIS